MIEPRKLKKNLFVRLSEWNARRKVESIEKLRESIKKRWAEEENEERAKNRAILEDKASKGDWTAKRQLILINAKQIMDAPETKQTIKNADGLFTEIDQYLHSDGKSSPFLDLAVLRGERKTTLPPGKKSLTEARNAIDYYKKYLSNPYGSLAHELRALTDGRVFNPHFTIGILENLAILMRKYASKKYKPTAGKFFMLIRIIRKEMQEILDHGYDFNNNNKP
ncbi:MAG: hypothetical protein PHH82_02615 [Candidatus ainarchaeum sp.]|nr:hypothetical protein [Candidatus ainarchaeum sp.]